MAELRQRSREAGRLALTSFLLLLLTAGGCLADGPVVVEGADSLYGVALVFRFDGPFSSTALDHLQIETDEILRPLSVEAGWFDFNRIAGRTFTNRLIIVRFKGNCEVNGYAGSPQKGALGFTHVTEGEVLPFVEISCEKVWGFIRSEVDRRPGQADYLFGRALARVLCHELYHVIGATSRHSHEGVTKALLTARELTQGALHFDGISGEAILDRLGHRRLQRMLASHGGY
jgi:hypothetical protein